MSSNKYDASCTLHFAMCKKLSQLTKVIYQLNSSNENHRRKLIAKENAHQEEIDYLTNNTSHRINHLQDIIKAKEHVISTTKVKIEWMEKTYDDDILAADEKMETFVSKSSKEKHDLSEEFKREIWSLREQASIKEESLKKQCTQFENKLIELKLNYDEQQENMKDRESKLQQQYVADFNALHKTWKEKFINVENSHAKNIEESNFKHLQALKYELKLNYDEQQENMKDRESKLQQQYVADFNALHKTWKEKFINVENSHAKNIEESNFKHLQALKYEKVTLSSKVEHLQHKKEIELSLLRSELTYLVEKERKEHNKNVSILSNEISSITLCKKGIRKELDKIKKEKEFGDEELINNMKQYKREKKELHSTIMEYEKSAKQLQLEYSMLIGNLNYFDNNKRDMESKVAQLEQNLIQREHEVNNLIVENKRISEIFNITKIECSNIITEKCDYINSLELNLISSQQKEKDFSNALLIQERLLFYELETAKQKLNYLQMTIFLTREEFCVMIKMEANSKALMNKRFARQKEKIINEKCELEKEILTVRNRATDTLFCTQKKWQQKLEVEVAAQKASCAQWLETELDKERLTTKKLAIAHTNEILKIKNDTEDSIQQAEKKLDNKTENHLNKFKSLEEKAESERTTLQNKITKVQKNNEEIQLMLSANKDDTKNSEKRLKDTKEILLKEQQKTVGLIETTNKLKEEIQIVNETCKDEINMIMKKHEKEMTFEKNQSKSQLDLALKNVEVNVRKDMRELSIKHDNTVSELKAELILNQEKLQIANTEKERDDKEIQLIKQNIGDMSRQLKNNETHYSSMVRKLSREHKELLNSTKSQYTEELERFKAIRKREEEMQIEIIKQKSERAYMEKMIEMEMSHKKHVEDIMCTLRKELTEGFKIDLKAFEDIHLQDKYVRGKEMDALNEELQSKTLDVRSTKEALDIAVEQVNRAQIEIHEMRMKHNYDRVLEELKSARQMDHFHKKNNAQMEIFEDRLESQRIEYKTRIESMEREQDILLAQWKERDRDSQKKIEHIEIREKKALENTLYFKRELMNREENFNRRFFGNDRGRAASTTTTLLSKKKNHNVVGASALHVSRQKNNNSILPSIATKRNNGKGRL